MKGFLEGFLTGVNATGIINCVEVSKFEFLKVKETLKLFFRNNADDRLWAI